MVKSNRSSTVHLALAAFSFITAASAAESAEREFTAQERSHWAFQKVTRPQVPIISDKNVRSPIDAFILAELKARNLELAPAADKNTLLRRASLDLIGLPPSPDELQAFLEDDCGHPFERAVDRLLNSPHYGERWARHWLDLARYAESEGFKADETRPNAWRYRDYVIKSFNNNKPYDRFLKEQLAGDELWPDDTDAIVATAFNRHYPDESNARNLMQRRQEILNDITDTVGSVFTGVTYGCARCHDHKYDPILQSDYYRLQAFFANTAADDNIILASDDFVKQHQEQLAFWEKQTRAIREQMIEIEEPKRAAIIKDYVEKYPEEIQAALAKPESQRTAFECQMVAKANLYLSPSSHQYIASTKAVVASLKPEVKKQWEELNAELRGFDHLHPGPLPVATGITDLSAASPSTYLLSRGLYDAPKDEVKPGFLAILNPSPATVSQPPKRDSTGRRAALASVLTDPRNPLTARVMVNRIWHYHFGRGIVGTPSDFGLKGDRPTHPALLDWLASEFIQNGWSMKHIHRLIMTSDTYRQASAYNEKAGRIDPENRLLWRFPRQRLEGEAIRDSMLAVSGRLNAKMGGPSVFPKLPTGMTTRGGWDLNQDEAERDRRSIYVFVRRNTRYPMFETFDMPDTHESCARRNITTSPIQALTMLNSDLTLGWAQSFAGRVLALAGTDRHAQIEAAYRLAYARVPNPAEEKSIRSFLDKHRAIVAERAATGAKLALPAELTDKMDSTDGAALVDFCHMLMNANEFVYRN